VSDGAESAFSLAVSAWMNVCDEGKVIDFFHVDLNILLGTKIIKCQLICHRQSQQQKNPSPSPNSKPTTFDRQRLTSCAGSVSV